VADAQAAHHQEFLPLAERTGLMGRVSDWVIAEACRQARAWRDAGLDLYVSVNLPPSFWHPTAMRHVLATIETFGLSPDRLMIEFTESAFAFDGRRSMDVVLEELYERGLRLAIDDFGAGHSSLSRLNQMRVSMLKIDRSFVGGLEDDAKTEALIASIVQLARNLRLEPLA
jgi:EAL domain-containing protein (putative c-di-GMP-specific phosphodiesterase class I)